MKNGCGNAPASLMDLIPRTNMHATGSSLDSYSLKICVSTAVTIYIWEVGGGGGGEGGSSNILPWRFKVSVLELWRM